jgi:uncharacterized membrane protein YidH (DUF202 family)
VGGAPGVPNERTSLAWQHTVLTLVASAAIMVRLTWKATSVHWPPPRFAAPSR